MALEQYFQEAYAHHNMVDGEDELSSQKRKSVADDASTVAPDNSTNGCFDCNICLDHARDPVVTLCGHLYCWPCIYKWLHFQSNSSDPEQQQPQCPICKANVSHATLVPLYGHGHSSPEVEESNGKGPSHGLEIPSRPPACGTYALITTATPPSQLNQHQQAVTPMFNVGGTMMHPMVGMFREMVYGRVFGNSSEAGFYGYSNSNQLLRGSSSDARLRRQEMKADRSLNRVSIFLFCFFLLCLILF